MIGSKQIDKIMCIACQSLIGEHTKRGLGRCLFRVQGTMIAEGKNQADDKMDKYKAPKFVSQEANMNEQMFDEEAGDWE